MSFLLPILLILGSLCAIVYLLAKRWRELPLLDVEGIPEVQEGRRKNEYLRKKVNERAEESKAKLWQRVAMPIIAQFKALQKKYRTHVGNIEKQVFGVTLPKREEEIAIESTEETEIGESINDVVEVHEEDLVEAIIEEDIVELDETDVQSIDMLLKQAQSARTQGAWEQAERKYIAALGIDAKNAEAYRGLADVYASQEQYEEAKETYNFLLQLTPNDDAVYVKLAELAQAEDNTEDAIEYYQQAVLINSQLASRFAMMAQLFKSIDQNESGLEAMRQAVDIEPENSTYLDNYADLAILVSSKNLAEEIVQRLRMVNPEHPKLDMLNGRIAEIVE